MEEIPGQTTVIVDTTHSAHAGLRPAPLGDVTLTDGFWRPRRLLLRDITLPTQFEQLERTGRLANFRRAAGQMSGRFEGLYFNDSDVYKWLEAASWILATDSDPQLKEMVDQTVSWIEAAQQPDGYLNTYYTLEHPSQRWTNLRDMHELYCAGHLVQAAIAHHRATGSTQLLDVACRFADLIADTFGPHPGQQQGVPGHPEIEMALVELARETGQERYLCLAQYFLDARGHGHLGHSPYHQDHVPFREMDKLVGHAVRALYLSAGATDLLIENGEPELGAALRRLWHHMATRQMYVTGGVGARHQGEAVGADYELPNARAYAETCAGIANVMWAWRLLLLSGRAPYADLMERALYNAVLPGISLDGQAYFYVNPLASDGQPEPGRELYRRQPWFQCACCPPNVARLIAQIPGYIYSLSEDTIWIHHLIGNEAQLTLPSGDSIQIMIRTRYPWSGQVFIEVLTAGSFALSVRIPGWCAHPEPRNRPTVSVNGEPIGGEVVAGHYVTVRRSWAPGDSLCIHLPMPVRHVAAHPYVLENTGRVALMRGPILYCLEGTDHPGVDLRDITVGDHTNYDTSFRPNLLGGIETITASALVTPPEDAWRNALYRPVATDSRTGRPTSLLAIPYFAWANREAGAMQVWLRYVPA
ncbi:MAG TPA: glycoside hydrolase family 127 protein [Chloroflexi bacterium]|nr:glycoside hydrolase family 127 protein [Chloroflexota bacterium]